MGEFSNDIELNEGQVIEVEFDKDKVLDYQNNYIMEEEGIGAEMGEVYDTQTEFNEDNIEDLLDLDEVAIESFEEVESE